MRGYPYFGWKFGKRPKPVLAFGLSEKVARREISVGKRKLDLNEVRAVWYRRALHPPVRTDISRSENVFVAGELRHLALGIVLNPEVTWVNPIDKVSVAELKLYQLQVARQVGFTVPRTLVSRDATTLRRFAADNKAGTICKPIFHGLFIDEKSSYSVYTRRITPETIDAASATVCPILLQEEIVRTADVRATFIGRDCFVADITGDKSLVDWRDPDVPVSYTESSLSAEIEGKCRTMLAKLGLLYGAFDFIRTPASDLVFLEVNPTGEWAWLEDRLGFPMRDSFVRLFYGAQT